MPVRQYANAPATTLSASATAQDATISVTAVTGLPTTYPYTLIIDRGTAKEEAVEVTAASGLVLTVTRGIDSTTAFAHANGATVAHGITARDVKEPNVHVNANSGVHGVTGSVVGTTDAQTLTGKTLALGSNTISGTKAEFNTAMTDADFATLTGTETLTNKTLTAPAATGSLAAFGGAWTAYTPVLTASTTNPTLGSGAAAAGGYIQIGKTVIYQGRIVFGTSGTAAGTGNYRVSLPVNASTAISARRVGEASAFDSSAGQVAWGNAVINAATYFELYYPTALPLGAASQVGDAKPMVWAASDEIHWSIVYEAA